MIQLAVVTGIDGVVTVTREEVEGIALAVGENVYEGDILDTSLGSLQVKLASGALFNIPEGQSFPVTLENLAQAHVDPSDTLDTESASEEPQASRAKYYAMLAALLLLAVVPAAKFLRDHKEVAAKEGDESVDEGGNALVVSFLFGFAQVFSGFLTKGMEFIQPDLLEYPPSGGDPETPTPVQDQIPVLSLAPTDLKPETGTDATDAPLWPIGEGGVPFIIPIAFPFGPVLSGFPTIGPGYGDDIPYPFGIFYVLDEPETPIIPIISNDIPRIEPDRPIPVDYRAGDSSYVGSLNAVVGADTPGVVSYQAPAFPSGVQVFDDAGRPFLYDRGPLYYHLVGPQKLVISPDPSDPSVVVMEIDLDQPGDTYQLMLDRIDALLYDTQLLNLPVQIFDNDLDSDVGIGGFLFDPAKFIVGDNDEDIPGATTPYVIGNNPDGSNSGKIVGASTADLLIGDGGTIDVIENQATFIFAIDISSSMDTLIETNIVPGENDPLLDQYTITPGDPDTVQITRLGATQLALTTTLESLVINSTGQESINVILIPFSRDVDENLVSQHVITTEQGLKDAIDAVLALETDGSGSRLETNYEAAY